jgi:predicted membrane channel-forming protein YqfA (hemolysin III family)
MGSGDKKTIAGVVVGLAAGGVYMTGPLAFPGVPVAVWQSFFLAMVATLAISAVYFALVHTIKEDRAMPISLMVVGGMIFFVGAIWLGVVNERKPLLAGANKVTGVLSQPSNTPDVIARFVYPKSPALVLVNRSDKIARQIKWSAAIWNLDDPRTYVNPNPAQVAHDPLPIPVSTFDFLRPHSSGGPQTILMSNTSNQDRDCLGRYQ